MKTKFTAFSEFKAKHPDALILVRTGEFYEFRFSDAEPMAKLLGLIVTRHTTDQSLYCAFPKHALDMYLPRIVRAGYRICIVEDGWKSITNDNKR